MWELISFFAGMLVLMLLVALSTAVFDLPDAIAKYFGRRLRRSNAGPPPHDLDEEAARVLGESLRHAELSPEAVAQVTAAFWAADARNRRALAHLVAGMAVDGALDDEEVLLAMLRSLREASASRSEGDTPERTS